MTWKKEISDVSGTARLRFGYSERQKIAEIVVPEHANITYIFVYECVNLTNIVLHPPKPRNSRGIESWGSNWGLDIWAGDSGLRNITRKKTMRDSIFLYQTRAGLQAGGWAWSLQEVQWTELPPNIKIKTLLTDNGKELEVIWEDGTLQIADAVNGEWKDYSGSSPLRVPLAVNSKPQQFFRIKKSESTTPQQ